MENTDGLHKYPMRGGTGGFGSIQYSGPLCQWSGRVQGQRVPRGQDQSTLGVLNSKVHSEGKNVKHLSSSIEALYIKAKY